MMPYYGTQGIVIKLTNCQFSLSPGNDRNEIVVGLKSACHANAGDLKGYIRFECEFVVPDIPIKLTHDDENLNSIMQKLDMIKGHEQIDHAKTEHYIINELRKKKHKPQKTND